MNCQSNPADYYSVFTQQNVDMSYDLKRRLKIRYDKFCARCELKAIINLNYLQQLLSYEQKNFLF